MDLQTALLAAVLLVGLAPLLRILRETPSRAARALGVAAWLAATAVVTMGAAAYKEPLERAESAPVTGRPIEVAGDGYVSSRQCRPCHEDTYASWHDSFHRRMTQVVTPQTVQSRIDGAELTYHGRTWRLFREGDAFFAEMDRPEWEKLDPAAAGRGRDERTDRPERVVRPLVLSTGSHHYELFWFSDETTRKISMLPFCWRIDMQRWLPVDAAFLVPPDEEQGAEGRWNVACNKCHATHARPRVAGRFDMDTDVAEFGIACEACHGPGEAHVAANQSPAVRYARHFGARGAADPTIVQPEKLDPVRASMVCGQCHAAVELKDPARQADLNAHGPSYRPGGDLNDDRRLRRTGAEKFWSDGMIRTSGREYNGLLQSPCYAHLDPARGIMTCFSCHLLHQREDDPRPRAEWADDQLKPGMRGDLACTQCHEELAAPAAIAAHTHHAAESSGSRCMDCHMPHVTYGLLQAMRSHTIASPSLAESLDVGRPNACNLCHLDQTLEWAGEKLAEWYGQPRPAAMRGGRGLAPDERSIAAGVLWIARGDAGQRALVAGAMERPEVRAASRAEWFAPFLAPLLEDPYHAVRLLAGRSLQKLPGFERFDYDCMAPPDERAAAAARARAQWESALPPAARTPSARLLIDSSGRIDDAAHSRLLSQRDDRRVELAE